MPSISLAVMVKDEAVRLQRCLNSIHHAVDEIVVLDTGSTDHSIEVAKAVGARVLQTEWPGSFSVAFNILLDEVKTDWTLRLDSDEWFEDESKEPLQQAIAGDDHYGYKLQMRDMLPAGGYREFSIFRLWRTHPKLRYRGAVHENIPNEAIAEAFPGMKLGELSLWMWHDGYAHGNKDKSARNLDLLEKELEQNPDQPYYEAMRALMYREAGKPGALDLLRSVAAKSLVEDWPSTRMLASVFIAILSETPDEEISSPEVSRVITRAWEWFCTYPGVVWAIGAAEVRRKNLVGALNAYLKLENLAQTGNYERSIPFNAAILGQHLWHALGFVAQQAGRNDIAQRCAKRLSSGF